MMSKPLPFRMSAAFVALLALLMLSGCASMYVDGAQPGATPEQIARPAQAREAQLLFTFESKGTPNAKATEFLKQQVTELVTGAGLFSAVRSEPVTTGAILSITIDNVPITDQKDAFAKGFATGFTFGLVGSTVTDGYICTVDYVPPGSGAKLTKETRHAIHTTMGAKGAPPNATKAKNAEDAVRTMTRQIVTAGLRDLSADPTFAQAP